MVSQKQKRGGNGLWKRSEVEKSKSDFSTSLGNPAQNAGFPLSHSPDCCYFVNIKQQRREF